MTHFTTYKIDNAPEASKPFLQSAKDAFGFEANLMGNMAQSPAIIEAYLTLTGIFNNTHLTETERQIILMTNNRLNGCKYCMAAHTTISKMNNVADDVIDALRENTPISDPKLEALRTFSTLINEKHGQLEPHEVDAFLAAGYSKESMLEVIVGTSLKVMSNYTNHLAKTPLDSVFTANAWPSKQQAS